MDQLVYKMVAMLQLAMYITRSPDVPKITKAVISFRLCGCMHYLSAFTRTTTIMSNTNDIWKPCLKSIMKTFIITYDTTTALIKQEKIN